MADSFIQLPPDSTGKKLDADELSVGANTVQRQRVYAIYPRGGQVPGRTPIVGKYGLQATSTSVTVFSPTTGKRFYMTGYSFIGYNTSATGAGRVYIKDGGTNGKAIFDYFIPSTPAGANPAIISQQHSFIEPIEFLVSLHMETAATADYRISLFYQGYEE